ncbi:MAG: hypothetical protein KDK76_00780 [Chlamydiia bacterium]|nr:hypothetical protein [Chlamydiia bacterium]
MVSRSSPISTLVYVALNGAFVLGMSGKRAMQCATIATSLLNGMRFKGESSLKGYFTKKEVERLCPLSTVMILGISAYMDKISVKKGIFTVGGVAAAQHFA